jgi:uncharacterized lipoprotein NlpE involved in copper resistance
MRFQKTMIVVLMLVLILAMGCANKTESQTANFGGGVREAIMTAPMMAGGGDEGFTEYDTMVEEASMPDVQNSKMIAEYPEYTGQSTSTEAQYEQKIIRTANLNIEVEDYFLASQKAEEYAKKYNGYVSDSNAYKDANSKNTGTITIRVPEQYFDAVMAELTLIGEVQSKNTNGNDVTEQYIDLESRLNNAQAHEERLVNMYKNASNIKEMMQVENELARVRQEVEQYQGRLNYLRNRVDLSTITVTLYEQQPVVKEWGIISAIKDGLLNALATIRFIIVALGFLLPLAVVVLIIVLIIRAVKRKKKR